MVITFYLFSSSQQALLDLLVWPLHSFTYVTESFSLLTNLELQWNRLLISYQFLPVTLRFLIEALGLYYNFSFGRGYGNVTGDVTTCLYSPRLPCHCIKNEVANSSRKTVVTTT